jgi:hypothetical protein
MKIFVTGFLLAVLPCCVQGKSIADGKADVALFANCAGDNGEVVQGICNFEIDDRRHLRGGKGFYTVFTKCNLKGEDGTKFLIRDGVINYEDVEVDVDSYDDENGIEIPSEIRIERTFHDKVVLEVAESKVVVATGWKVTHITILEVDSGDEHLDNIDTVEIVWDQETKDCAQIRDITLSPQKWALYENEDGKL